MKRNYLHWAALGDEPLKIAPARYYLVSYCPVIGYEDFFVTRADSHVHRSQACHSMWVLNMSVLNKYCYKEKTAVSLQVTLQKHRHGPWSHGVPIPGCHRLTAIQFEYYSSFSQVDRWTNRRRGKDRNTKQNALSAFFRRRNLSALLKCPWNSVVRSDSNNVLFSRRWKSFKSFPILFGALCLLSTYSNQCKWQCVILAGWANGVKCFDMYGKNKWKD